MLAGRKLDRRRMLQITAAACGTALLRLTARADAGSLKPVTWRGVALGAAAQITLYCEDEGVAREALDRAVREVRRLEGVFSLYLSDSAVSRLNRQGTLLNPPLDLVRLLSTAKGIAATSGGAFDPTIQPLWVLYAEHYSRRPQPLAGPDARAIEGVLARVDHRAVRVETDKIAFERPGMGITLNGIAQGYITDRIADILKRADFRNILVDLGEFRGVGAHPSGQPWRVSIASPGDDGGTQRELQVVDQAVATSAPLGTPFEASGKAHHLLDPRTGRCANLYRSVTVTAPRATAADGFSTAFAVMEWRDIERVVQALPWARVDALDVQGNWNVAEMARS